MIALNGGKEEMPKTNQVKSRTARVSPNTGQVKCKTVRVRGKMAHMQKITQKTAADMSVSAAVL